MVVDEVDERPRWWFERVLVVVVYVAAAVGAALALWAGSHPNLSIRPLILGVALLGAALFIPVVSAFVLGRRAKRWRWHAAIVVAVGLVAGGLCATDLPMRARWAASEGAFNREIGELPAPSGAEANKAISAPSRIGWYTISSVAGYPGGYLFTDASGGDLSDLGNGFAYMPDGLIPELADHGYDFKQLDGAWYAWVGYS